MFGTGLFAPVYQKLFAAKRPVNDERSDVTQYALKMNLDVSEAIQFAMANGTYEPQQTAWASSILKPGNRFVDIGASFGHYTSLASSLVGSTGKVFAFEPSPLPSSAIARYIETNSIKNIELVRGAVGSHDGEIDIYLPAADAVVHSPSALTSDPSFTPFKVKVFSLDTFAPLNDGKAIDLMKVDVEGFEPDVVAGMTKLARSGAIRNLMCEFNTGWLRRNNSTAESLKASILDLGFRVSDETNVETHLESDGVTPYHLQDILFRVPT